MRIPDKYRDRYDYLARSHPWMREMRDEQAPEGDAVAMLRKYATFWGVSHETYTQCDSNWEVTTMRALADMVERDYVRRETHIKAADIWQATCDECEKRCRKLEAERDEWKAKAEARSISNLEWMYLNNMSFRDYCQWVLKEHPLTFGMDFESTADAGEWLVAPHDDAQRDTNGTCPDGNETCPDDVDSRENLGSEPCTLENFEGKGSEVDADECADCAIKRANRVLSQSVDRLTRERDALAVDLADAMAPHAVDMYVKLDEGARLLERAHPTDAGADLFAPYDVVIPACGSAVIDTGVHVQIPGGCCGLIVSKSGLNVKCNIWDTGLVDEGYGGSIVVKLYNLGDFDVKLPAGSKISQLVVLPVLYPRIVQADEIASGARGSAGFGSTDAPLTVVDGNGEVVS